MAQMEVYDRTPDIALAFYRQMYPDTEQSKKRGFKSTVGQPRMSALDHGEEDSNVQGEGNAEAGAAAAANTTENDPATQIAERLKRMGDEINQTIAKDFQEKFEEELRKHTLFTLACDEFKHVCTVSLARVQSKVRSGWHQVWLLYNGYAYTAHQVEAEAGEAGQDRVQSLGSYLSETMRTTALVEWITDHGGWENLGSEVTGDDQVVQINVPQNGTSVD